MPGTPQGGRNAAKTNKIRYGEDFYQKVGAKGGRNGTSCGILYCMSDVETILGHYKILSSGVVLGINGQAMRPQIDGKGYLRVQIKDRTKENGVRTLKIHRVVANAFLPNPNNLPQVNHKDLDKSNNDVSNLEWITNEENQRHAKDNGVYDGRLPDNVANYGGQVLTAILNGYVASDLFEKNGIVAKTFWRAVTNGVIGEEEITSIDLGRKKKYCYYDKSRNKWRVERSDYRSGKQFKTEAEAVQYATQGIGGGFYARRDIARSAGRLGGKISRKSDIKLTEPEKQAVRDWLAKDIRIDE